ncbi:MAG: hypothetical protein AAF685_02950 [Cyanobacteria bacterium P01_C01_bin.89]
MNQHRKLPTRWRYQNGDRQRVGIVGSLDRRTKSKIKIGKPWIGTNFSVWSAESGPG